MHRETSTPTVQTPEEQTTTRNTSRFGDLRQRPETAKGTRQRKCANEEETCKGLFGQTLQTFIQLQQRTNTQVSAVKLVRLETKTLAHQISGMFYIYNPKPNIVFKKQTHDSMICKFLNP